MIPLVLYHGQCRDGFCAAWVAHRALGKIEDVAVQYGTPAPDVRDRDVYMLDFSYPREIMLSMIAVAKSLLVLDHHKTAAAALDGLPGVVFDVGRSGAGITWDHFFPGQPRPWLVNYVEDRDLWAHKLPRTDAINAFVSALLFNFATWDHEAMKSADDAVLFGEWIERKTMQYVIEVSKNAIRWNFEGHNVPLVNIPQVDISEVLSCLAANEPMAVGWWQRADGKIAYSLRSRESGVDVAVIAGKYGGGGHTHAAGFQVDRPLHIGGGP